MAKLLEVAPVAHSCNSSYSGGRDQEDWGSKSAREIVWETLSWKNSSHKRADGMAQGPEFKPQNYEFKKKKKKETRKSCNFEYLNLVLYGYTKIQLECHFK
jgi:hypothetical protein